MRLHENTLSTPGQKGVLTRDRFRIGQLIKAADGIAPDAILSFARQAGEVVDAGERLRVFQLGMGGPYVPEAQYFLMGFQDQSLSRDPFRQELPPTRIEGVLACVEGSTDIDAVLPSTFEVQRVIEKLKVMASQFACLRP